MSPVEHAGFVFSESSTVYVETYVLKRFSFSGFGTNLYAEDSRKILTSAKPEFYEDGFYLEDLL